MHDLKSDLDLLSISETAAYLGCSPALVRKLIRQGDLPAIKLGRLIKGTPRPAVSAWLEHQLKVPA